MSLLIATVDKSGSSSLIKPLIKYDVSLCKWVNMSVVLYNLLDMSHSFIEKNMLTKPKITRSLVYKFAIFILRQLTKYSINRLKTTKRFRFSWRYYKQSVIE